MALGGARLGLDVSLLLKFSMTAVGGVPGVAGPHSTAFDNQEHERTKHGEIAGWFLRTLHRLKSLRRDNKMRRDRSAGADLIRSPNCDFVPVFQLAENLDQVA